MLKVTQLKSEMILLNLLSKIETPKSVKPRYRWYICYWLFLNCCMRIIVSVAFGADMNVYLESYDTQPNFFVSITVVIMVICRLYDMVVCPMSFFDISK